jgi:hypothetical protein
MPVSEVTRLKAKAGKLKIANYRTMGADELKDAIAKAENGSGPKAETKKAGKKATNNKVSSTKTAGTRAAKTSPPATKSNSQKSPTGAATGKAKRETTTKAGRKSATVIVHQTQPGRVGEGGYTNLDRGAIDWTVETTIAQSGKRAEVLAALRKHSGDYALAFEEVRDKALGWFPTALRTYPKSSSKLAAAERMTRWLVNRVAYDFAYKTGQHLGRAAKKATTAKSTKKTAQKTAGAAQKAGKPKKAVKATSKPKKAQKAAQGAGKKLPATAKARQSTRKRGAR